MPVRPRHTYSVLLRRLHPNPSSPFSIDRWWTLFVLPQFQSLTDQGCRSDRWFFQEQRAPWKFHAVMHYFETTIDNKRSGTHRHRHCTRNCQKTYGSRQSFPFWVSLDNREVVFYSSPITHNVEQCSFKVYSISTYFSGPHRPRSRRNSSVRPFEAFELWFLENIHTQKYFESSRSFCVLPQWYW